MSHLKLISSLSARVKSSRQEESPLISKSKSTESSSSAELPITMFPSGLQVHPHRLTITSLLNPDSDCVSICAGKRQPNLEDTIAWEFIAVAVNTESGTILVLFLAAITIRKLQHNRRVREVATDPNGHCTLAIFSHDRDNSAITALGWTTPRLKYSQYPP